MIISAGFIGASSGVSFVEFTTAGTNQSITSAMIPAGVTRVRVHVVGAGGFKQNGGSSSFSANGVSVIATGGVWAGPASLSSSGGSGGGVSGTAGYAVSVSGGAGGYAYDGEPGARGVATYGVSMGGGGGGGFNTDFCGCYGRSYSHYGGGGGAGPDQGIPGPFYGYPAPDPTGGTIGGNGGGYGVGDAIPLAGHGKGVVGDQVGNLYPVGGGGAGGYAYFTMNLSGATTYTNAITVGDCLDGGLINRGYVRIEWGSSIT